jgi:hypothetical protein
MVLTTDYISRDQRREESSMAARKAPRHGGVAAARTAHDQHLPVTELLGEYQGANSPYGDDLRFPLPLDQITYEHPEDPEDPEPVV